VPQPKAKAGAVKSRDLHPRPSRFRLQLRLLQRFVAAQGEGGFDAFLRDGEGADWQWPERAKYPEADVRRSRPGPPWERLGRQSKIKGCRITADGTQDTHRVCRGRLPWYGP
jgi:hypothetical protein